MAMKLSHVDASFLAGECDPAIEARLDDVVRANAARRIRNMYVRSAGGVRTRPGMRVGPNSKIEDRQFEDVAATLWLRQATVEGEPAELREITVPAPRYILPAWAAADAVIAEIRFGRVLPAGTTIQVRMRNAASAPASHVTRLYWWEHKPDRADDTTTGSGHAGGAVGRWRSGAGLGTGREGWDDLAFVDSQAYRDYAHTLIEDADRVRIWRREWQADPAGLQDALENRFPIVFESWRTIWRRQAPGSTRERPPVRILDVTWWFDDPYLLALHGGQATAISGGDIGNLTLNPHGFDRDTRFTRDQVLSMQVARTPDGAFLHSSKGNEWRPYHFRLEVGRNIRLRLTPMENLLIPIPESGPIFWSPGQVPSAIAAHQSRLIVCSTRSKPNGVWFSKAGERHNFRAPAIGNQPGQQEQVLATDAFMVEELGHPLNRILAVHGGLLVVFFGSEGISFLDTSLTGGAIRADAFGFRENAERGIKEGVPPAEIGTGKLAFVDRSGESVWQMTYANERQGYILTELSQVAPHLLDEPEDLIFHTGLPDGGTALIVVNKNGSMAVCSMQPENEWHAWSLWTSGQPDEDGITDILDVEQYEGGLWAATRRGEETKAIYVERFDPALELDFCQESADGSHDFHDAYTRWAAIAVQDYHYTDAEGNERVSPKERYYFGFGSDDAAPDGNDVAAGLQNILKNPHPHKPDETIEQRRERLVPEGHGVFDYDADADWQVGQRFQWEVATMPFVKRTGSGSVFQGLTKTQEVFVNMEAPSLGPLEVDGYVPFTINGERKKSVPRLFSRPVPRLLSVVGEYAGQQRFLNLVGWRDQNLVELRGSGALTITSLSRTVLSR